MKRRISRRTFVRRSAFATASFLSLPCAKSAWGAAANERLNVALVGVGGRGKWFVDTLPRLANIVALCDVDEKRAGDAFDRIPTARKFHDFRRMLETMDREIDGVVIATPDNTHAVIASMAMKMGKHVYCEKPLTHDVYEARYLRRLAEERNVVTQMGNQGTASEAFRKAVDVIQSEALGAVREVHVWNDSGGAGQRPVPTEGGAVPDSLRWDLWLGPAQARAYHPDWMKWHTWRDFATGQLGNWAVHSSNLAFKALKLDTLWLPGESGDARSGGGLIEVEAKVGDAQASTFPRWETIRYRIPSRGDSPPVAIHWHNGRAPGSREQIEEQLGRRLDWGDAGERKWRDHAGLLIVGSRGKLHANGHNTEVTLLPEEAFRDFAYPSRSLPRSPGHEQEWLNACRGGPAALSNFNYGGPLTEFVLLGNVATLHAGPLEYDPVRGAIQNHPRANAALKRDYRDGWSL